MVCELALSAVVDSFCEESIHPDVNRASAAREAVAHKERRYASR